MRLVYFGNKLSKHGRSKSVLETLEPMLGELCEIKTYSNVRNQYFRLLDMLIHFFKEGLHSDLIMIDVYSTKNFYFAYILARLSSVFNKHYILFLHGGNLPVKYSNSKKTVDQIFKRAKAIVAPSNYLKSFFESKGFSVVLIPNIVDIRKFPFQRREITEPRLFYIRGFGKIYNPQMTVRVVEELRDEYPGIKLAMIGTDIDGSLQEVQKLIDDLELGAHVEILGKKSQSEWVELSKQYNIMLSNPIIDNTPVSIIEGMALGLLIISTDVGGVSYLISDNEDGMLVQSEDHEGMANAIREIINNPLLSIRLQQNARKKAELFSWENVRPKWENLLNYCADIKFNY